MLKLKFFTDGSLMLACEKKKSKWMMKFLQDDTH